VLVEEVVLALEVDQAVRVVDEVALGREVIARAMGMVGARPGEGEEREREHRREAQFLGSGSFECPTGAKCSPGGPKIHRVRSARGCYPTKPPKAGGQIPSWCAENEVMTIEAGRVPAAEGVPTCLCP
jgi:hypothetical protein